jgi:hypothetical protein
MTKLSSGGDYRAAGFPAAKGGRMMILAAARQVAICAGAAIVMSLAMMTTPACAQDYAAIVAQPDRSDADRQTDKRRDPVNLLTFTGAKTGWTVLDMGAGAGYSTELMGRTTLTPRSCGPG